ncbi:MULTISPECIES: hypothetical protein [unclassified Clostridium]|uniref:hypothetical protein n=1 Tax=unclassified Clostridium TaxID=2614128 RepID=UPI00029851B4|nr:MULTISPECIES: hypothetical protein [unclassified Clostridium]EKQ56734.1 MAG: hypothetical protein A370_01509 [Clostridium sp. Maddingley MBC34-26]
MRFLPFIKGQDFLIIYALFAIVGVIVILKIIRDNDSKDFIISNLNEENYYVLKNKYNVYNMFYYITYRLYVKGLLLKDEEENKFYVNKDMSTYLSNIEEQVYILYIDKFAPKDFKPNMIKEIDLRNYYNNIYEQLVMDGLIKDDKIIKNNKLTSNMGMIVIFVPGIWRIFGGIVNGMPVSGLIFEIIIIFFILKVILSIKLKYKLTKKGKASMEAYERYYKELEVNGNNIGNNSESSIHDFLMTNSWRYFLGVSCVNSNNNNFTNNDSGGASSSCSSCSSGSSCSSCSSCGGCGGN